MFTSSAQLSKARKSVAIASAIAMTAGFAGLASMGVANAAEGDPVVQTTMGSTVTIDGETINLAEITIVPIVMDGSGGTTPPTSVTPTTAKPEVVEVTTTTTKPGGTTSTTAKPGATTSTTTKPGVVDVTTTTSKPSVSTVPPTTPATNVGVVEITTTTVKPSTPTTAKPASTSTTAADQWVEVEDEPATPAPVATKDDTQVLGSTATNDPAPVVQSNSGTLAYTGSSTFGTLSIAFLFLGIGLSLLWYQMGRRERAMN